jgi:nucleotide-binding universal stress UspA family protein
MDSIRVLIPTDFSVQAEYAFLLVNNIAQKTNCEIHFLHVLNVPETVSIDSSGNIQTCGEIDIEYVRSQKEIAERKIAELKVRYGSHISGHIASGKIKDSIVNYAEQNRYDLIAIGTKGAWGLKESISGNLSSNDSSKCICARFIFDVRPF